MRELAAHGQESALRLDCLVLELLLDLRAARRPRLRPTRRHADAIDDARRFLDEQFAEPIDLALLAARAYLSPFHFHRLFRRQVGVPPHRYLVERRLERAAELLRSGLTAAEAAAAVGVREPEPLRGGIRPPVRRRTEQVRVRDAQEADREALRAHATIEACTGACCVDASSRCSGAARPSRCSGTRSPSPPSCGSYTQSTGSPAHVGYLVAVATAPVVVGGPLAGLALDRLDRRLLLVCDTVVRGVAVGVVPLLAALDALRTWELYVVAALHGLLKMIPLAGVPSLIPELVEDDELEAANGLESVSFALAAVVGPAAAGALVAMLGAANVLILDAASYALFALALVLMPPLGRAARSGVAGRTLRDALRFVLAAPILLATTAMFMLVNVGEGAVEVVLPVYAVRVLHGGAGTYGALASVAGCALLVGSLAAGAAAGRLPLGVAIGVAELLAAALLVPLALEPGLPLTLAVLAAEAFFLGTLTVWAQTIRMRVLPADLRGRVFALLRTSMQATPPAGALVAAPLLGAGGISLTVVVAAAVIGAPAVAALLSGVLVQADRVASVQ